MPTMILNRCISAFVFTVLFAASLSLSGQQFPRNPDPHKCYVRCVTPDVYNFYVDSVYSYTEEDAMQYAFRKRYIMLTPETSRWESTALKGCESDDPNDCQVLCYRTYPEEGFTYLEPVDPEKGTPYWQPYEVAVLLSKGGLSSYEEIDCKLTSFNVLAFEYREGSAVLRPHARSVVDDVLLSLLTERKNLRIQINAHTAARGSAIANQDLSESRAQGIADYLISKGINRQRLVTRGYGESQLKNRCADGVNCSEWEHAVNNRIEFRVLNVDM